MGEKVVFLKGDPRSLARLDQALKQAESPHWKRRAESARVLRESQDLEAVSSLIRLLRDEREEVRVVAAYSLAELRNEEGLDTLIQAAAGGWLGSGAELALVLTMVAECDPKKVKPLLDNACRQIKLDALRALTNSGHREVAAWILGFLTDDDDEFRAAAARGLGVLRYGEGREYLRRLLTDHSWKVKTNAAWSLRYLRAERAGSPTSRHNRKKLG